MIFRFWRFLPSHWWKLSAWKSWKTYMVWRLETYGVYDPDERLNRKALMSLLRQTPSYLRWLNQFERLRDTALNKRP